MVGDVKDAYYDYYYLGRALAVAEESVQLLKSLEDVTLTQYGTATTDFSTVIKVQIERDRLKSDVAALKDQQQVASARLAAVLGLPSGTPLPLPTRLPESPAPPADVEKLVMTNNPELDALQRKALAEDTSARLARRSFLPDFSVGVNFMTMSGPEDDNETDQSIVAGVTLPLWIGKYRAEAREAEARSRAYQLERTDKANALGVDLKMAIYAFRDAERRKALYRDSLIPQAEQALKVIRQAFSNGKADFSEVIDAQRNLLEFRLQWERACVDREKSLANIDRIAGKDPDVLPPGEWNAETKGRNDEP
jgi:outer membrane protein TolC